MSPDLKGMKDASWCADVPVMTEFSMQLEAFAIDLRVR